MPMSSADPVRTSLDMILLETDPHACHAYPSSSILPGKSQVTVTLEVTVTFFIFQPKGLVRFTILLAFRHLLDPLY